MIKYIELKTNHDDSGPAWIARVKLSRSKQAVYFGDKMLRRAGELPLWPHQYPHQLRQPEQHHQRHADR
ncbi:hypothetical protein BH09SUM1_BH09SUM1_09370 [soil metagenome]